MKAPWTSSLWASFRRPTHHRKSPKTTFVSRQNAEVVAAALATMILANCGGTDGSPLPISSGTTGLSTVPTSPASTGPFLLYSRPLVFTLGVAAVMGADNVSSATTITVSPKLPIGLSLDSSTGTISGTPTVLSAGQLYTLSAVSTQGAATTTVQLEVNDGPLFYPSPTVLALDSAMAPLVPNGTTYLSGYSVSPALPRGLSIDATTGVISGTPTEVSPPAYYTVIGADSGFDREYGLTLMVTGPSAAATQNSSTSFNCTHSGGFVGTFSPDSTDRSYGLITIAFSPDGNARARVADLTTYALQDSDGLEGLSPAMDGSFLIGFGSASNLSLRGIFIDSNIISGSYQKGTVSKSFIASRLGGSPTAQYRYSGGFGNIDGYRADFGAIDVTGSALTGAGYQMGDAGPGYVLINRHLSFAATISGGMYTVTVDGSTTMGTYSPGQSLLDLGDPYDSLFFIHTQGCQLR